MKKIFIILLLLSAVSINETDAAMLMKMPDLKDKHTIKSLKNGTYKVNGIAFGMTRTEAEKAWGKPKEVLYGVERRYITETKYKSKHLNAAPFFGGKKGMKQKDYELTDINLYPQDHRLSMKQVKKYWGAYDFKYHKGGYLHLTYGNVGFTFEQFGKFYSLSDIWYATDEQMALEKRNFKK